MFLNCAGIPFLDSQAAVRPGTVLEIVGPSGSGKTELSIQTAVTAILPKVWNGCDVAGWEGGHLVSEVTAHANTRTV